MENLLYIIWGDANNVRIPIIDEQHRGIVATINSFHYLVQKGRGLEAVRPTLNILEQYTTLHFKTEEALMAEADYPGLEAHILLHKELLRKTRLIACEYESNDDMSIALKFLKEWWLCHINEEDRKYAPAVLGSK